MGNLRLFRLNRVGFAAREILGACHILRLKDLGVDRIAEGCASLAVYGGFAAGSLDERSDLAILVIGEDGCYIASCPQFKGCHSYGEAGGRGAGELSGR